MMTPEERRQKAARTELRNLARLIQAAKAITANVPHEGQLDALKAAAKAWVNAYHQRGRVEKALRDQGAA